MHPSYSYNAEPLAMLQWRLIHLYFILHSQLLLNVAKGLHAAIIYILLNLNIILPFHHAGVATKIKQSRSAQVV